MLSKKIKVMFMVLLVLCFSLTCVSAQTNITSETASVDENIAVKISGEYENVSKQLEINEIESMDKLETSDETNLSDSEGEFIDVSEAYAYMNAFRTEEGVWYWNSDDTTKTVFNTNDTNQLKPLVYDAVLEQTAKTRAKEMALNGTLSHKRPDSTDCWTAYPDYASAENIARGQKNCEAVTESWKENNNLFDGQGHRRNMLDLYSNSIGIAGYKLDGQIWWVQSFGCNNGVSELINIKPNNAFNITNNTSNPEFKIILPNEANGNFFVTIDGNKINNQSLNNGEAIITATNLTEGLYKALISYSGDNHYYSINLVSNITVKNEFVSLINTSISAFNINMDYGDDVSLVITLKDNNGSVLKGKNVSVTLNDVKYYITDANGQVIIPISLNVGNYTAQFSFNGDGTYNSSSGIVNVVVNKKSAYHNDNINTYGIFIELNELIQNASENSVIKLEKDYEYDNDVDSDFIIHNSINHVETHGIEISKFLTIDGQGHKIDAKHYTNIFEIGQDPVILKNIIFLNGNNTNSGGALNCNGSYNTLTIINCTFIGNIAKNDGGAIYGDCFLNNSKFINNIAGNMGGAIYGNCSIINSTFNNNSASLGNNINPDKLHIIANKYDNNDKTLEQGCCSFYLQISKKEAIAGFRRDEIHSANIYIKIVKWHGRKAIKQYKTANSYFFHLITTSDGWMIGNGGADNPSINRAIEKLAGKMIKSGKIKKSYLKKIQRYEKMLGIGHFAIKKPNGKYATVWAGSIRTGKLKPGQYLSVPNYKGSARLGNYVKFSKNHDKAAIKVGATDPFGVNRRDLTIFHWKKSTKNFKSTSKIKIFAANDNGHLVGRQTSHLKDNLIFKNKFISKNILPQSPKKKFIGKYSFGNIDKLIKIQTKIKAPKVVGEFNKTNYFKVKIKNTKTNKVLKKIKIKIKVSNKKFIKNYKLKTDKHGIVKLNISSLKKGSYKVIISTRNNKYIINSKSRIKIM